MRALLLGRLVTLLGGCAHADKGPDSLPYKYWRLGFLAPDHMEVWVETADVEDIRGQKFFKMGGGTVSVHLPKDGSGDAVMLEAGGKPGGRAAMSMVPTCPSAFMCAGSR